MNRPRFIRHALKQVFVCAIITCGKNKVPLSAGGEEALESFAFTRPTPALRQWFCRHGKLLTALKISRKRGFRARSLRSFAFKSQEPTLENPRRC